jgi:hypothetical protein
MIHIITHILPQEIDQLEQLLIHLKKSSKYIKYDDYLVEVVLNTKLTKWDESKIDENFFINKFNFLEKLTNSWCKTKFEISDGSIIGCNDIRRRALRTSTADYIMYLDADNIFSETLLYYMKEYSNVLNIQNEYNIIVPQTTRMWDITWDIITNENYFNEDANHENYFNRDPYLINRGEEIKLVKINDFKFAGWGTCIPTKLREIVDIPDSLGSYGLDDTFIMNALKLLKNKYNINQYVLNDIIIENNKFRYNPYKDYLVNIDRKEEFLSQSHQNYEIELLKYK